MSGTDPAIDNLQAFVSVLEAANQILDNAVPDLDARGKAITEAEPDLREALTGLATDTHAFETDLEASAKQAKEDALQLGTAGHQALEARLPALDGHLGEAKAHLHQVVTERGTSLESELDELEHQGFDAIGAVVTQEQGEFERWTQEADAALGPLTADLETDANQTAQDIQTATTDLHALLDAVHHEHSGLDAGLNDHIEHVVTDLSDRVIHKFNDLDVNVPHVVTAFGDSVQATVTTNQEEIRIHAKEAGVAIQEESQQAEGAVQTAGTSLGQAGQEFEQCAQDADWSDTQASDIADLRPRIEAADAHVVEIQAVMNAMSPA